MKEHKLYQVIMAPHVSEKAAVAADSRQQYVFKVADDATKPLIKEAVEALFSVKVQSVQVCNARGKMKYGKHPGKRRNWKKAYVRLETGQEIDFLGAQ